MNNTTALGHESERPQSAALAMVRERLEMRRADLAGFTREVEDAIEDDDRVSLPVLAWLESGARAEVEFLERLEAAMEV